MIFNELLLKHHRFQHFLRCYHTAIFSTTCLSQCHYKISCVRRESTKWNVSTCHAILICWKFWLMFCTFRINCSYLLFTCYINDLSDYLDYCDVTLYADDAVLFISDTSLHNIKSYMNYDLEVWTSGWS